MKKIIIFSMIFIFLLASILIVPMNIDTQKREQVIIYFYDDIDETLIDKIGGKIIYKADNLPLVKADIPVNSIKYLESNPKVKSVQKDISIRILDDDWGIESDNNLVSIVNQEIDWGVKQVGAEETWDLGYTGKGVNIAVIDTGVSNNHEDLVVEDGISFVSYTDSYNDDNGHGTHVAGIIGAEDNDIGTVGVAPDANIYAVKVLDSEGYGYISDIIAGIDWAISNDMDIINLSLGTALSYSALKDIIDIAEDKGIFVVSAAGNNGDSAINFDSILNPARYSSTIAVQATDSNYRRASFSSVGSNAEMSAPGVDITSTFLNNKYANMSGTSMATPHVTGALALMKEAYPLATYQELRIKLHNKAIDLGDTGYDYEYGYGLANISVASDEPIKSDESTKSYFPVDIEDHWSGYYMLDFTAADILSGYRDAQGNTVMKPDDRITRAEFVTILVRALGLTDGDGSKSFTDVKPTDWYYQYVKIASANGIINGVNKSEFAPNKPIRRDEMATIIVRAFESSIDFNSEPKQFTDVNQYWATPYINKASSVGIVNGVTNDTFKPLANATRAEASVMLYRALHMEATDWPEDSQLTDVISKYFLEANAAYNAQQYDELNTVIQKYTTGFYKANEEYYSRYFQNMNNNSVNFTTAIINSPTIIVVEKSDKFAIIEVQDLVYDNHYAKGELTKTVTQDLSGTYYLKRMTDGSWKIYNAVLPNLQKIII